MAQTSRILLAVGFSVMAFGFLAQGQIVPVSGLVLVAIGMIMQAIHISDTWYNRTADIILSIACLVAATFILRDNDIQSQPVKLFLTLGFLSQAVAIGVNLIRHEPSPQ